MQEEEKDYQVEETREEISLHIVNDMGEKNPRKARNQQKTGRGCSSVGKSSPGFQEAVGSMHSAVDG